MERETLPTKMQESAVVAEMMIRQDVNFQALYEATGVQITDDLVEEICEANSAITKIQLNSCNKLTDFSLVSIGRCCQNLQSISLGGCINIGHVGLRSLAMSCRQLRSINFVGYHIDDGGLRIIAASLDRLESLDLTGCIGVTDRGLSQIAHCCTKLKILKLGGCYKIGESGVWAFYELENCRDLEEIELMGCTNLSNRALLTISKRCPSLRNINISECPCIQDKGIHKLITVNNKIVSFSASRCGRAINDEVASHIIQNLNQHLVKLDLSYCQLNEFVTIQIASCSNLKSLNVSGCRIDDNVIAKYSKVKLYDKHLCCGFC